MKEDPRPRRRSRRDSPHALRKSRHASFRRTCPAPVPERLTNIMMVIQGPLSAVYGGPAFAENVDALPQDHQHPAIPLWETGTLRGRRLRSRSCACARSSTRSRRSPWRRRRHGDRGACRAPASTGRGQSPGRCRSWRTGRALSLIPAGSPLPGHALTFEVTPIRWRHGNVGV
jgi:hypothetical protein